MKTIAIVQARMSSSRFPGKVLRTIGGTGLLDLMASRLARTKKVDQLVFAISSDESDDPLHESLVTSGYEVFRGSLHDVQQRFVDCAKAYGATTIVRVTGDCPLIDWKLVDSVIQRMESEGSDYCSNVNPPTFPDGLDVEAFSVKALIESRAVDDSDQSREHVTLALRESGSFSIANVESSPDLSHLRWTVDYPDDLSQLEDRLPHGFHSMTFEEILETGFTGVASSHKRNEGMSMGSGQKLWTRAKEVIPGGGMFLSKRAESHLPDLWPSYYSKAKGITVTDLDGNSFLDFSLMSVGTCSLGYGVESVDEAVRRAVTDGVMSTLNSPAEVALAERLLELHPWSDMVRFARAGGEANAMAIRIARASTGRDKVAICGYHGWHDWYLSANLAADSNLDGHLLPGLEPSGVPRALEGLTNPFEYNNIESLRALLVSREYAAVKMEVTRNFGPTDGFLESVRELCTEFGTVLIFDECTSGFRESFGGIHLNYGVEPDLAMFGKALGNGFPITAVIGRKKIMEAAQGSFISSTFWSERLGPVAALATLEEMARLRSWELISSTGAKVKAHWKETFEALGFDSKIQGLDALASFTLELPNWNAVKTLFTQLMLDKGFLATPAFYASAAHSEEHLDSYFAEFDNAMKHLRESIDQQSVERELLGPEAHVGFKRLN